MVLLLENRFQHLIQFISKEVNLIEMQKKKNKWKYPENARITKLSPPEAPKDGEMRNK